MEFSIFLQKLTSLNGKLKMKHLDHGTIDYRSASTVKTLCDTLDLAVDGGGSRKFREPNWLQPSAESSLVEFLTTMTLCNTDKSAVRDPFGESIIQITEEIKQFCVGVHGIEYDAAWTNRERACRMLVELLVTEFQKGSSGIFFSVHYKYPFRQAEERAQFKGVLVSDVA
ncbi:MAG: hypothetical protein KBC98_00150 [Candidatus Pacebacteria bacterium]|nr:hypothetical protein [Candidatus Paceibacterota bacterium]